ncbi:hypothetical protein V8E55_011622 [Tylopilus felleus]
MNTIPMDLPAEVIQHIFSFLTPCEIVRLRQVSALQSVPVVPISDHDRQVPKQFRDNTHEAALWRKLYINTCWNDRRVEWYETGRKNERGEAQ